MKMQNRKNTSVGRWMRVAGLGVVFGMGALSPTGPTARAGAAVETAPTGIDKLFDEELSDKDFQTEYAKAKTAGAPEMTLVEAKMMRAMSAQDKAALITLLPDAQRVWKEFDPQKSHMFDERNDATAMLLGMQALEAGQRGDSDGFEKAIKEAFWTAPKLASLFSGWAAEFQTEQRLANVRVPLETKLKTYDGKETTLREQLGDGKALLVDFWASWCGPCISLMPELKTKGQKLVPQGIKVVGMNVESDAAKAKKVHEEKKIQLPWLLEPQGGPYSELLEVSSIPRMVLIAPDGRVLFNGHPQDAQLKTALAQLGVKL